MLLGVGIVAATLGIGMAEYAYIGDGKPLAIVNFKRTSSNTVTAHIKDHMGKKYNRELSGDYWLLSAQVINWNRAMGLNIEPMVRLERIYALNTREQATTFLNRSSQLLHPINKALDVWGYLKALTWLKKVVSLQVPSTTKQKFDIGVTYSVGLTKFGLKVTKSSTAAKVP